MDGEASASTAEHRFEFSQLHRPAANHPLNVERMANRGRDMMCYSHTRQRGFTAIEALIAASAIAVVVMFTIPKVGQRTARSELNTAVEILQSSIVNARQTARIYHAEVVLSVQTGLDESSVLSYLVRPPQKSEETINFEAKNYPIPPGVRLVTDRDIIRFNASGVVVPPAHLVLVATADENVREQILLE